MRATKPAKPYKDFPLTAHPRGTWCKKIKGKIYHFGGWSDPDAALAKYRHQVDDLQAGREPGPMPADGQFTVEDLCFEFLDSKQIRVDTGLMSRRMLFDYQKICKRITAILGRSRIIETLKPKDFDAAAASLAKGVSLVTFAGRVRMSRTVFRFASEQDLISRPLKFGENFRVPDKAALRAERHKVGSREFTPDEIKLLIEKAGPTMKAMILMGINCGFGNNDCAMLPISAIDLKDGWINFPRPKTAVERRCPLWPETVKAVRVVLKDRPQECNQECANLVFVTRFGNPYVRTTHKGTSLNTVTAEFGKLMKELQINGNNRAFYSLRRSFETIAGNTLDQISVDHIMGHSPPSEDMAAVYRQSITDERLRSVSDHVRAWLWPKKTKASGSIKKN